MTKRITISSLIFAMLLAFMPVGSFAKNVQFAYPIEEPELTELPDVERPIIAPRNVQFIMNVKWGQVEGPVQQSNKVIFDGSISTNIGSVALMETMRFEQHDDYRDQITNNQNPVAWRSWISTHWDGIKVMVDAPYDGKVTIDTYQGTVGLKINQLAWTRDPFKLKLPDGREIVITTKPVPQTQHYMKVYWGAVKTAPDFPVLRFDLQESQAEEIQPASSPAEELKPINIEVEPMPPILVNVDFSGILGVSGATLQFMSPYLFEPAQGDKVTYQDSSTVAWDSKIVNHVDGVWLRTFFKHEKPKDERFGIAFMGDANLIKFYDMKDLFANKRTVETINVYGWEYQLVIETFTIDSSLLDQPMPVNDPISVSMPASGDVWYQGETHTIKWDAGDYADYMRYVKLIYDDTPIGINSDAVTLASGEYNWDINLPTEVLDLIADKKVRIRVGVQPETTGIYADSAPFVIKKRFSSGDPIPLPINPPPKNISWPQLFDLEPSADTVNAQDQADPASSEPEYISVSDPRRFDGEKTEIIEPNLEAPKTEPMLQSEETKPLYDPDTFSYPVNPPLQKEEIKKGKKN